MLSSVSVIKIPNKSWATSASDGAVSHKREQSGEGGGSVAGRFRQSQVERSYHSRGAKLNSLLMLTGVHVSVTLCYQ